MKGGEAMTDEQLAEHKRAFVEYLKIPIGPVLLDCAARRGLELCAEIYRLQNQIGKDKDKNNGKD